MGKKHFFGLEAFIVLFLIVPVIALAVPGMVNYQGKLTNSDGTPVDDGTYNIQFSIYNVSTGGTALWTESQSVIVTNGIYNVKLGSLTPIPTDILDNSSLYLGVKVGSDSEMTPRIEVTSTFYALKAGNAESLEGHGSGDFALVGHTHSGEDITSGTIPEARIPASIARDSEITWGNLMGIPSDIADGDDVGITEEHDPTVPGFLKDGVDWTEIANRPPGLDDGDDVGITAETDPQVGANTENYIPKWDGTALVTGTLYDYGGKVSIGTTTPTRTFEVVGTGMFRDDTSNVDFNRFYWQYPYPFTTKIGVRGEVSGNYTWTYGVQGVVSGGAGSGVGVAGTTETGKGVQGIANDNGAETENIGGYFWASGGAGKGVYARASNNGDVTNYGGYFIASGLKGRGIYAEAENDGTNTNYGGYFKANSSNGFGVYGYGPNYTGVYGNGKVRGVYGYSTGSNSYAVAGYTAASNAYGGYFGAGSSTGTGIYAHSPGWAADFRGKVRIRDYNSNAVVMELGSGLDYAEGFHVMKKYEVEPGMVLVIDPEHPGKLKISQEPYDTKVAGIVAGAEGLGSGVRLGAGQFDHDVALAGRVYCFVDATKEPVRPGDLLTTSDLPGYAMKARDYDRAKGAILGKAMEPLSKGKKGKILVLVTLQ